MASWQAGYQRGQDGRTEEILVWMLIFLNQNNHSQGKNY